MNNSKQYLDRIDWIDYSKAIGIFLIVFGHVIQTGKVNQYIYSFHVPLFFFLSGVTFKNNTSFSVFLKKKIKTILIPYLSIMFISIIIYYFLGSVAASSLGTNTKEFSWTWYILGAIYGNAKTGYLKANLPLWFLPCLFVLEILLFVIDKYFLADKNKKIYYSCLIISIIFLIINNFYSIYPRLPFSAETAFNAIPFALVGYGLKNNLLFKQISQNYSVLLILALFVINVVLACTAEKRVNVATDFYGNIYIYLITSFCGIFSVVLISKLLPKNKILSYVGKNTLVILLLHKFPVLFFQVIFKPTKHLIKDNNLLAGVIVTIVSMVMCIFAGIILERFLPCTIGKSKKQTQ